MTDVPPEFAVDWHAFDGKGYAWMEMYRKPSQAVVRAHELKAKGRKNIYIDAHVDTSNRDLYTVYYDGRELTTTPVFENW